MKRKNPLQLIFDESSKTNIKNHNKVRKDSWSENSIVAYKIAMYVGNMRKTLSDQAYGKGNVPHYHTYNRKQSHLFFYILKK